MSFGKGACPAGYVVRSFTTKVMSPESRKRRAHQMLVSGGDAWAWVIDRFHDRIREGLRAANSLVELWPDQKAHGAFGELTAHCAQDVAKAWSAAYFETVRRKNEGERARLPLRKRQLVPITWRKGEFVLVKSEHRPRVELSTRRGTKNLTLAFASQLPYDPAQVRAVRLCEDSAGDLYLTFTAFVAVNDAGCDQAVLAGVDPGVIHPLAVASQAGHLLISGRAVRAEEFLHLKDQKARQRELARHRKPVRAHPGKPRQAGSRRWRQISKSSRRAEERSRRRVRLAADRAANLAAAHIVDKARAGTVVIGDPKGIEAKNSGRVQNRRVGRWARTYTRDALRHRLEECAVRAVLTDERGTSSRCPACQWPATKQGRWLTCLDPNCRKRSHRDVAGARNMPSQLRHAPIGDALTEHRRVGSPTRRDKRRHLYERRLDGAALKVEARTWAAPQGESPAAA